MHIRQVAPSIFSLDGKYFTPGKNKMQRNEVPTIQKLLGRSVNKESGAVSYARFPPVLYQDPNNNLKVEGRFQNPCLFMVCLS